MLMLNVAITRAAHEVVVFASFDSSMIDLTRTKSLAVTHLKEYLAFAETGSLTLPQGPHAQSTGTRTDLDQLDSVEQALTVALAAKGWQIRSRPGVSRLRIDLGVIHPEDGTRYLAGIRTDGVNYGAAMTARDRDLVSDAVFRGLGWSILRIWTIDYFTDPTGTVERLHRSLLGLLQESRRKEVERRAQASDGQAHTPSKARPHRVELTDRSEGPTNASERPRHYARQATSIAGDTSVPSSSTDEPVWKIAADAVLARIAHDMQVVADKPDSFATAISPVPTHLSQDQAARFYDEAYRDELKSLCLLIVDAEGPLPMKTLCVRVARLHGLNSTGSRIVARVEGCVAGERSIINEMLDGKPAGETAWPADMVPAPTASFRGVDMPNGSRTWSDIAIPERRGLVHELAEAGSDDLARSVGTVLGFGRITGILRAEIEVLRT